MVEILDEEVEKEKLPVIIENYAREILWENGLPKVIGVPMKFGNRAEASLRSLMREALDLPYDGNEEKYRGLSKGEALIIQLVEDASTGDAGARREVLDRVLGKPQQNIKSLSIKGSIESFLAELPPPSAEDYVEAEAKEFEESVEDL